MKRNRVSALAAGAALVVGSALTVASPATAADANPYDPTFTPDATTDIVGVGSDTTQIVAHDLAAAYNAGRSTGRIASWAADGAPSSITLRAGASAITRPNGSGAGKKLLYGATNDATVNFARSSSTLSTAEVDGGLKQAAFAVDGLQMAVSSASTNAPESLTLDQIRDIYKGVYTNWSQVGGRPGTIKALVPQSGSGTLSYFTSLMTAANGGTAFTPVAVSTQEHSDADIKNDPNAISPFSSARATITPTVKLEGGWKATRAVYDVFRTTDLAHATRGPVLDSIFGEDGWICSAAGRAVIEAAGFDQLASVDQGGACGEYVTGAVSNLKTADQADATATTTTLTAATPGSRKVVLKATVAAGDSSAAGKVEFHEGDTKVGTAFPSGGVATLTLSDVTVGNHRYVASFVPTDDGDFGASQSAATDVVVKTPSTIAVTGVSGAFGKAKTAKVTATVDGAPAVGTVSVKVGSAAAKSYPLAGGTVSVPVVATTPAGALTIVATLPGTAAVDAATVTSKVTIAKAKASASAKLTKTKIRAKQRGSIVVKVAPTGAAKGIYATGKVTITSGKKVVGTGTLKNGKVSIKVAKLKKGTHKLVASYAGSANVSAVSVRAVTLKVTK